MMHCHCSVVLYRVLLQSNGLLAHRQDSSTLTCRLFSEIEPRFVGLSAGCHQNYADVARFHQFERKKHGLVDSADESCSPPTIGFVVFGEVSISRLLQYLVYFAEKLYANQSSFHRRFLFKRDLGGASAVERWASMGSFQGKPGLNTCGENG